MNRRQFLKSSIAAGASLGLVGMPGFCLADEEEKKPKLLPAKADAMVVIYLPGGVAQHDTWDPKKHTPFEKGMRGSEMLGTCPVIDTAADPIKLGAGLENLAGMMDRGTVLRALTSENHFGAVHLKAQYFMMTGYLSPAGFKAPSMGAIVSRTLGRRDANVPPYIYIGRDIDTSDPERLFISEYIGPGFYGVNYQPFMIPDPAAGLATLNALSGMPMDRLDRRQALLHQLATKSPQELRDSQRAADYLKMMDDARAMMDSPVKKAFDFKEEKAETIKAYQPQIKQSELRDQGYYWGNRFGNGLLLARRLLERGARFIQVELQYGPFKGFDMHEYGQSRMVEMKKQIDRSLSQFIKDLEERGLLERTLVVVVTEFGRTIASAPSAGTEPDGFAERHTGEDLIIADEKMYGFHGHFSSVNTALLFGGGVKKGYAHGRTADQHPMVAVENPVDVIDFHATLYRCMGIPADWNYVTEERPVYVTNNGKGKAVEAVLA